MENDYKTFYAKEGDGPRQNALRAGRLWASRRKTGGVPYRIDRDGDAQMGEGPTAARRSLPETLTVNSPPSARRGAVHVSRSRSISFTGPGVGMRLPSGSSDVFSRLGARPNRDNGEPSGPDRFSSMGRGGRGAVGDRPRHHHSHRVSGGVQWFKVRLLNTSTLEDTWLKKMLQDNLNAPLDVQMTLDGNARSFHMQSGPLLDQLRGLDRKLNLPHGTKMSINITPSQPPKMLIDENVKARIKDVMATRYDGATEALNLTSFAADPTFLKDGLSINLWRPSVATAVVDLILANTPHLRTLDLGKNRIRELTWLSKLGGKIPLERLNLSENELGHPGEVDRLKSLTTLQDLTLTGNPLCKDKDFRNNVGVVEGVKYVDYVRKRLPGLRRLDGVDLPKVILFDAPVQAVQRFPPPVGIYVPSEELRAPLMKFVQDFFFCYDGRRQDLMQAYAEDAQFSLEFLRNSATDLPYQKINRNLLFSPHVTERVKRLFTGKADIVTRFASLPFTQHIPESFSMDVFLHENSLTGFNVAGCFREGVPTAQKRGILRAFSRNFVIRQSEQGLSILSDMLTISLINKEQSEQFASLPVGTAAPPTIPPQQELDTPNAATQAAMVTTFASQSGMNEHFSAMCLADNGWNFDKARLAFLQLQTEGKLPAEAFIK